MKITLELRGDTYSVEKDDEMSGDEMIELFTRLMVVAGFSPNIIYMPEDGGRYEYVGEDEEVVKKEKE